MGNGRKPGVGHHREYVGRHAGRLSATLSAAVLLAWFLSRSSPGVALGPWQGHFLSEPPIHNLPLLSQWAFRVALLAPAGNPAWRLNVATACFAALSCGALAYAAATVTRRLALPYPVAGGLLAACAFATTPLVTYGATGTAPTTLTAFLALAAIAALLAFVADPARSAPPFLSALFAGLAAANHPSFGLLLAVIVVVVLLCRPVTPGHLKTLAAIAGVFALTAAIPLHYALGSGESFATFLSHALLTPYPAPGSAMPRMDLGKQILDALPVPILLAIIPGLLLFAHRESRPFALICAGVFLCMGPFLPSLTNQHGVNVVLADTEAPRVIVIAVITLFAAWGLMAAAHFVDRKTHLHNLACYALFLAVAVFLAFQYMHAPDRRHDLAPKLAGQILKGCPQDSLLVTGDPDLTSLLLASQRTHHKREDVTVAPAHCLASPFLRAGLRAHLSDKATLQRQFPPEDAWKRWEKERPLVFDRLARRHREGKGVDAELADLALWDFVADNSLQGTICFAGVASSWLPARAKLNGLVLVYPCEGPPTRHELDTGFGALAATPKDPGIADTLARLLLPLADNARAQGWAEESLQLAKRAVELGPRSPSPMLAVLRAEARNGQKDKALEHAERYLQLAPDSDAANDLQECITQDLRRHALERDFIAAIAGETLADADKRQETAEQLWLNDELVILRQGYESIIEAHPDDLDALYQLAAAYTQLGELPLARNTLQTWIQSARVEPGAVAKHLEQDGRFALLQSYPGPDNEDDGP